MPGSGTLHFSQLGRISSAITYFLYESNDKGTPSPPAGKSE
jgi:hypothetical protein